MPATLVHIGVQGPLTRWLLKGADLKWVLVGCILPDLPWIGRHLIGALPIDIDPYRLMAYAFVQAALLSCLILAAALALLSRRPARTFTILALGAVLHLLLDAVEIKLGNGVHLLAPFDWRPLSFALVWPDGPVVLGLTGLSAVYCVWLLFAGERGPPPSRPARRRLLAAAGLGALWLLVPFAFLAGPVASDTLSLRTLLARDQRPGAEVAFDRRPIEHRNGSPHVITFAGEALRLTGADLTGARLASLRGRFVDPATVEVELLRVHPPGQRDLLAIAGLGFAALWWLLEGVTALRSRAHRTA